MIEVRGLTKFYGEQAAVSDLSFTVRPGIVTGFLGPNGAGKSTTMRLILGLDSPCGCRKSCRPHATWAYSWIRPPSRSRRRTRTSAPGTSARAGPAGGFWWSARCGRQVL
jgi:ABC-type uncharacterized transport system ATPase subunit